METLFSNWAIVSDYHDRNTFQRLGDRRRSSAIIWKLGLRLTKDFVIIVVNSILKLSPDSWSYEAGADPGVGLHCLGYGQIFERAKQLFCLLVLLI